MKKTIIFIIPRNPYPTYSGFAKHNFFIAKELKKLNYKLILISLNFNFFKIFKKDFPQSPFEEHFTLKLSLFDFIYTLFHSLFCLLRSRTVQLSFFSSPLFKRKFEYTLKNIKISNNVSFVHIFSLRTINIWPILNQQNIPFFIDLIDSVGLTFERYSQNKKAFKKLFYKFESRNIARLESRLPIFSNLKSYSIVSKIDLARIKTTNNSKIYSYPIGIELENYKFKNKSIKKNYDLIFFGSLEYSPNLTAIIWFIKEIYPLLLNEIRDIKILVTGFNPPNSLVKMIKNNKNIFLKSNPERIQDFINSSRISIAPMLTGSGQQNKVIESMALSVPVVLTSKAAKPLNLSSMNNCIIANNPNSFSSSIKLLLENENLREEIGINSYNFVVKNHNWSSIVSNLQNDIYV